MRRQGLRVGMLWVCVVHTASGVAVLQMVVLQQLLELHVLGTVWDWACWGRTSCSTHLCCKSNLGAPSFIMFARMPSCLGELAVAETCSLLSCCTHTLVAARGRVSACLGAGVWVSAYALQRVLLLHVLFVSEYVSARVVQGHAGWCALGSPADWLAGCAVAAAGAAVQWGLQHRHNAAEQHTLACAACSGRVCCGRCVACLERSPGHALSLQAPHCRVPGLVVLLLGVVNFPVMHREPSIRATTTSNNQLYQQQLWTQCLGGQHSCRSPAVYLPRPSWRRCTSASCSRMPH